MLCLAISLLHPAAAAADRSSRKILQMAPAAAAGQPTPDGFVQQMPLPPTPSSSSHHHSNRGAIIGVSVALGAVAAFCMLKCGARFIVLALGVDAHR